MFLCNDGHPSSLYMYIVQMSDTEPEAKTVLEAVITEDTEISALFSMKKKKMVKKSKISLENDETKEAESVEIVKKYSGSDSVKEEDFEVSKLDYSTHSSINPKESSVDMPTAINQYDTEFDHDHLTRRKEALERSRHLASKGELDTKYRGLKGYQQFLMQGDTAKANAGSDKNRVAGPVRAAANLRVTCRFDYKPDLCKDYNETGFCGFGDSCIFLHDRTEHKSSYQLEQEWEAEQKRKRLDVENADSLVPALKPVKSKPTECPVCKEPFTNPVRTKCLHYYCEKCAFGLSRCVVCKSYLMGSFKPASKELK